MSNHIELKTINSLSKFSFYIPSYQRGYRWTSQEVTDLLNDINDFKPKEIQNTDDKTWYCLQPIVVKKLENSMFEVIDGQQRLTTLYLILYYLNLDYVEEKRDKLFEIDYQSRTNSTEFLKNPDIENNVCIDFHYIHEAYKAIEDWFNLQDEAFDKNNFRSKIKFSVKVIWYETDESNPISVFTRLNIGKISLTNSELIKALFLNSSNFLAENTERLRLRQIEIANEWDIIENSLQNDKLWYFLTNDQVIDNRIELIFNMISSMEEHHSDSYATFRYFNKKLNNKSENDMKKSWETTQEYYQRFNEWFKNRELYHKIGFILSTQISTIKELYSHSSHMKKNEYVLFLNDLIKNHYKKTKILDLDYENKETRNVLLLYNILTMLRNSHDDSSFPFDVFKTKKWNKEHIASIKDSPPSINREGWLKDVKCYIDLEKEDAQELVDNIETILFNQNFSDDDDFTELFNRITEHFNKGLTEGGTDELSNLALLDEATNKSYKNAVFPLKRKRIIDLDKSGEFVPLCTKNTFLKYFSDYPPKISFWTQDDKEMYEKDLIRVLSDYMEVGDNG